MAAPKDPISEIEQLLEELESYADKSPWYLPNKTVVKDEDFFRIIQRIRELLPAELAEAKTMLSKRDLILKNAQEEHRRILDSAERRLEDLTSEEHVVLAAQQEAELILEGALREAESLKRDALLYTTELLEDMEQQFMQTVSSIQKGREFLEGEISEQVEQNLADVPGPEAAVASDDPDQAPVEPEQD